MVYISEGFSASLLQIFEVLFLVLTWIVVVIYTVSGLHDIFYDISNYVIRLFRRVVFRHRPRLSLKRLRAMEEQFIAIFVPAWSEAEVIDKMIDNIIRRVEYHNFIIFVGTYPNDQATQAAVDALAVQHPQVVKVVTARPGPTSKADCLNNVYTAMEEYERQHDIHFDIISMHDAEDFVHPYECLLFNYLIPRIDAVQTPILPLPVGHWKWVHWVYADEFAENHMKDVLVREMTSGFVPFAGVATGFSRRGFRIIQQEFGTKLFNEESLTEDYSLAKRMRDMGLRTAFVNVILKDDDSRFGTPLAQRTNFIASWAYFPMDFARSVRQKTRWITGINFQEWELTGWGTDFWMNENLFKDRKGAIAYLFTLLGYIVFGYFILYVLGEWGWLPFTLLPLVKERGIFLYLLWFATALMLFRTLQRVIIVSWVYGIIPGLLSIPRQFVANVINGLASYRAVITYFNNRFRGVQTRWEKTEHKEGVGAAPITGSEIVRESVPALPFQALLSMVYAEDIEHMVRGIRQVTPQMDVNRRKALKQRLYLLVTHPDYRVRASIPAALAALGGENNYRYLIRLLMDSEWIVRANTARSISRLPAGDLAAICKNAFRFADQYGREVLLRTLENRADLTLLLRRMVETTELLPVRDWLLANSYLLRSASLVPLKLRTPAEDEPDLSKPTPRSMPRSAPREKAPAQMMKPFVFEEPYAA